jgi:hypothetical protein
MVGYMVGSTFVNAVYAGIKIVGNIVKTNVKTSLNRIKAVGSKIRDGLCRINILLEIIFLPYRHRIMKMM